MGLLAEKALFLESGGVFLAFPADSWSTTPMRKAPPDQLDLGGFERPDALHEIGAELCGAFGQLLPR